MPFSTFIGYCKELYQNRDNDRDVCFKLEKHGVLGSEAEQSQLASEDDPQQVYLAQVGFECFSRYLLNILHKILVMYLCGSTSVSTLRLYLPCQLFQGANNGNS